MSVGRERRVQEALKRRGGGTVGKFDTKLHPRDRHGKWRDTFNSPERTMMEPRSGPENPPPGAIFAITVNGHTRYWMSDQDVAEDAEAVNAYAETGQDFTITDLRTGKTAKNRFPAPEPDSPGAPAPAARVSRRGDERPNALNEEEHRFVRGFGPIPEGTEGLRELRARVAERIASSPDDGGPRFRAQLRKTQRNAVKKIDAAIRGRVPLIVPQAAPAPAPAPRPHPAAERLAAIKAATGIDLSADEAQWLVPNAEWFSRQTDRGAVLASLRTNVRELPPRSPDDGGPTFRRRMAAERKGVLAKIEAAIHGDAASHGVIGAPGSAFNPHPGAQVQIHTPDGKVHTGASLGNGLAFVQRRNSITGQDEMHVYHIKHGVGMGSIGAAGRDASRAKYAFQRHWAGANTDQSVDALRADTDIKARATNMRPIIDATNTPAHDEAWQAQRDRASRSLAPTDALDAALGAHRRGLLSDHIAGLSPVQRELVSRGAARFPTVDGVPEIMAALGDAGGRERRVQAEQARARGQRSGAVVGGKAGRWVPFRGKKKHVPLEHDWSLDAGDGISYHSPAGTTDVIRRQGGVDEVVSRPGERITHPELQRTWSGTPLSSGAGSAPAAAGGPTPAGGFDLMTHWSMTPDERMANLRRLSDAELAGALDQLQRAPGTTALGKAPGARRGEDAGGKERAVSEVMAELSRRDEEATLPGRSRQDPVMAARIDALRAMAPGEHRVIDGAYVKRETDNSYTVNHGYGSERYRNRANPPGPGEPMPDASDYFAPMRDTRLTKLGDVLAALDSASQGAANAPNIMMTPMVQAGQMESRMEPGDKVAVRWTGGGDQMAANAVIKRMNRASAVVTIEDGPSAGRDITIPLHDPGRANRWSVNNRILPRNPAIDTHMNRQASTPISGGRLLQRAERDTGRVRNAPSQPDGKIRFLVDNEGPLDREGALRAMGLPPSGMTPAEYDAWLVSAGAREDQLDNHRTSAPATRIANLRTLSDVRLNEMLHRMRVNGLDGQAPMREVEAELAQRAGGGGAPITADEAASLATMSERDIRRAQSLVTAQIATAHEQGNTAALTRLRQWEDAYAAELRRRLSVTETEVEMDDRERRIEEAMCDILAADPALQEAHDKGAEPFSHSKTSNWVAKAGGLPHYIQHIAHDLMEKRGMPESKAIAMAIGIVKRWARGGGKVKPDTRAAAAKAVAEWEAKKAKAHAA